MGEPIGIPGVRVARTRVAMEVSQKAVVVMAFDVLN